MSDVELKPCPFCGGQDFRAENTITEGVVQCRKCKAQICLPHENTWTEDGLNLAVTAWNTRADLANAEAEALRADIARLRDAQATARDDEFKEGQFAATDAIAKRVWNDGTPPHPYGSEWFIAKLDDGSKVVLRSLPDEYSYDYTTRDETYLMSFRVAKWMQFPDSGFIPFMPDAIKGGAA